MSDTAVQAGALRRALAALEKMQARLDAVERARHEPVAIIGIGCRLPGGADGPDAFWRLLREGRDAVGVIPPDRWDADAYYDPDPDAPGKMTSRWGAFLSDIDQFDPQFFGITPREAAGMDPQQRLLLEVSWEALENAGIAPDRLGGSDTGVFVGIVNRDYEQLSRQRDGQEQFGAYFASGNSQSIASGRLSYVLGLQGPSLSIDTACSSSLVAVHQAVLSLRAGECRMALAGGVNAMLVPESSIAMSRFRMLSPDGRCKTFDATADGFARGEGCGVVVLKRLSDALADGDRVLAVIRGSAINQDGASSGLTAPNGPAQEAVIRRALEDAGVEPGDVGYVEAHGTGTALGDPIEVQAVAAALGRGRAPDRPLLLGSVKTNLGHLEAAAGIAGLIKLVLCLYHGEVPPHLHFATPNPLIPWARLPVRVPTQRVTWPLDTPRVGGVSSFGFSGTNAHLVLSAAPAPASPSAAARPVHLITLSARNAVALRALAIRMSTHLAGDSQAGLAAIAHTMNAGRAHHSHRVAVRAESVEEARRQLGAFLAREETAGSWSGVVPPGDPPRIAFLFTGQGSQYVNMGRQLWETEPAFRATLERCDDFLGRYLERPLLSVLYPDRGREDEAQALLDQTLYTQPALFCLGYALAELWTRWGVTPYALLGHSVGEYAAACLAGVFSLEDGLRLIVERARLMQALPAGGGMAAVMADLAVVEEAVAASADRLSIAAINGPSHAVVSGDAAALETMLEGLASRGIEAKRLNVSHAFHSPLMEPVLDPFGSACAQVRFAAPQLRLVSNVTGRLAAADDLVSGSYWSRHVRTPVRFAAGMRALQQEGVSVFLEIGPGTTLLGMGRACLPDGEAEWVPSLRRGRPDWPQLLEAVARLYVTGAPVDWSAFDQPLRCPPASLPTYPFQRQRYWVDQVPARVAARRQEAGSRVHPLLGRRIVSPLREVQFENLVRAEDFGFINDHVVGGTAMLPAAGMIELCLAAAEQALPAGDWSIADLLIRESLIFDGDEPRAVQTLVDPGEGGASVRVLSRGESSGEWQLHATARLIPGSGEPSDAPAIDVVRARCTQPRSAEQHLEALRALTLDFGPAMQGVAEIHRRDGEAIGRVQAPDCVLRELSGFRCHPALLDACLQLIAAAVPGEELAAPYLPLALDTFRSFGRMPSELWSHVTVSLEDGRVAETLRADVRLLDPDGRVVAVAGGLALRPLAHAPHPWREWLYQVVERPAPRTGPPLGSASFDPQRIAAAIGAAVPALTEKYGLATEHASFPLLEALSTGWIVQALRSFGVSFEAGKCFTSDDIAKRGRIVPRHIRLLERLLGTLAEDGILEQRAPGEWRVLRTPDAIDTESAQRTLVATFPAAVAPVRVLAACGSRLADAMRGDVDPLALLFPGGSLDLVTPLYSETPKARVFNGLVQEGVRAAVADRPRQPLRVLEIGAGTGSTTAAVLPHFDPACTRYVFTDLSPAFLARARDRFTDFAFVDYRLLDIEKDPDGQGFAGEQFDIILAVNVLHATADLQTTLRHVHSLMSPGGLLVLVEGTAPERWIDISFGLTNGWWRFRDVETRPDYPLLAPASWRSLLDAAGFEETAAAPADAERQRQVVLLARKPLHVDGGRWLLVGDGGSVGERLAALLRERGHHVARVARATAAEIAAAAAGAVSLRGVVHLAALAPVESADDSLEPLARELCESALDLVRALGSAAADPPRVWLVTRGARAAVHEAAGTAPAMLSGLAAVLRQEHPELQCVTVELAAEAAPAEDAAALLSELLEPDAEDRIVIRAGVRHVRRLVRWRPPAAVTESAPQLPALRPRRLLVGSAGVLEDLAWGEVERTPPGPGQVEIRVRATGLNFRDVMNALAMRRDEDAAGGECSGTVVATGAGVNHVSVGDEVIAIATGGFGTFVVTSSDLVLQKPPGLESETAAGLPVAFLTAYDCLFRAAQLRPGERILVHAAAGGVGLAAVRLAQHLRAEVLATAGSEVKRDFLRACGITHVFDSRSPDFAEAVATATGGRGVDVVLNSLAGEFIPRSLDALGVGGRFVEIGKRDIWTVSQVAARRPDVQYHVVDLAARLHADAAAVRPAFRAAMDLVADGSVEPLPTTVFPAARVAEAFRFMAQAKHIGKVVVTQPITSAADRPGVRADASYLVTGGLGGLGLLTARWLAERGAGTLVLVGRHAPGETAGETIRQIEALGVRVHVVAADVSKPADVRRVLSEIDAGMPPLRGVIHAAGVLEDGALLRQSWESFARVLAPKVDGSWLLHRATVRRQLDFFVLYSSIASILGSPGQGSHAAANAFLDALALHRRAHGLPALSIDWGVWSRIGSAAERGVGDRLAAQGVGTIAPEQGLQVLELLLKADPPCVAVQPVDWSRYLSRLGSTPAWLAEMSVQDGSTRGVAPSVGSAAGRTAPEAAFIERLRAAPAGEQRDMLSAHLQEQVGRVVGLRTGEEIDERQPLKDVGVDSLMAVELRNRLGATLGHGRALPATLVFDHPTIAALVHYFAGEVLGLEWALPAIVAAPSATDLLHQVEGMSDEDVERLLAGAGDA